MIKKIILATIVMTVFTGFGSRQSDDYVCLPCGYSCDTAVYKAPGTCSHCNMPFVKKSTVVFKKIDPATLCTFVNTVKKVVLLDVRTKEEFNGTAEEKFGRLKNAVNIPIQELEQRINELAKYKNSEIVVYCSHSHRSPRASYLLTQKGFKKVSNMQGGMSVWKEQVKENNCTRNIYIEQ